MRRLAALAAILALTGCTAEAAGDDAPVTRGDGDLAVLAGSELADLGPILDDVKAATGVTVKLTYAGSLDGVETVATGKATAQYDAVWFAANRYLELAPGARDKIAASTKVMNSPVVLGVRASVAKTLGWDAKRPSWADIATAAGEHRFSFGMTNPAASNSGFSALVGVAEALSGAGTALTTEQVTAAAPKLRQFFGAQQLTAGSSGWLADAYLRRAAANEPVDALVNYESVLLSLNAGGKLREPLTLVYPSDGVVSGDYPLSLLAGTRDKARTNYQAVADYLRRPEVQQKIVSQTHRRPGVAGVSTREQFPAVTELPFPARYDVVNALVSAYFDQLRRPTRTIYVLDVSGSMAGDRLAGLKAALSALTGADTSLSGQFTRFHDREQVTLIPFSNTVKAAQRYELPGDRAPLTSAIGGLSAAGGTAVYDGLVAGYQAAADQARTDPDRFTSIVLLTDGESNAGRSFADFQRWQAGATAARGIPVFAVLFGEGSTTEMTSVAELTGGRTFDARSGALTGAFKDIRGYQ